jgi:hypothetical protein
MRDRYACSHRQRAWCWFFACGFLSLLEPEINQTGLSGCPRGAIAQHKFALLVRLCQSRKVLFHALKKHKGGRDKIHQIPPVVLPAFARSIASQASAIFICALDRFRIVATLKRQVWPYETA